MFIYKYDCSYHMMWEKWTLASRGNYWYAKIKEHPYANENGYVLEHRIIMENSLNRILTYNEIVHHINGNGKDNRLENLELRMRGEHTRIHNLLHGRDETEFTCPECLCTFVRETRQSHIIKGGTRTFCSRKCAARFQMLHRTEAEKIERIRNNVVRRYQGRSQTV